MAYERPRLSTESDKSTSTTYSTESTTTYCGMSPNTLHSTIPTDQKLLTGTTTKIASTNTIKTNSIKRSSTISSPAELILARTKNSFVDLNPYFQCSSLPNHWRKNKSLRFILRTKTQIDVKDNTRVIILAGNDYNPCAALKKNISWFRGGQAEFNDLRFLGVSGRGKKFTLTIIIETTPFQQCTYRRAIKITVDGPRKKRELKVKSDPNENQVDESNSDGDSNTETQTTNTSMMTDTKPVISQGGSAGLLLLAAAAEQKRNEKEEPSNDLLQSTPMEVTYSSDCLSPSSLLASQFSHSIGFSSASILSADDFSSRITRHVFIPNQSALSNTPTTNIILSLTAPNRYDLFHHQPQRHDQQTIVATSTSTSSSNTATNTHVLCR